MKHTTVASIADRRTADNRRGVTLIELMIALSIGAFLVLGAVTLFSQARAVYRSNEIMARLQENGRFALAALAPDARLASYFGLTTRPAKILGRAGANDPPGPILLSNDCGPNWSVDLERPIQGWNNAWSWTCTPRGQWAAQSDSFVVRRVAVAAASPPLDPGRLYVQSARLQDGQLFRGPSIPAGFLPSTSATHELVVSGYYVSENSILDEPGKPVPSLRRKILQGLRVVDEEVMPGVEDLQIQFGIDTDPPGTAGRGAINRFVNPGDAIIDPAMPGYQADAKILALRVWLRIRAETSERGFDDTRRYVYADRQYVPAGHARAFPRMLISKTIYLRNARQAL